MVLEITVLVRETPITDPSLKCQTGKNKFVLVLNLTRFMLLLCSVSGKNTRFFVVKLYIEVLWTSSLPT